MPRGVLRYEAAAARFETTAKTTTRFGTQTQSVKRTLLTEGLNGGSYETAGLQRRQRRRRPDGNASRLTLLKMKYPGMQQQDAIEFFFLAKATSL